MMLSRMLILTIFFFSLLFHAALFAEDSQPLETNGAKPIIVTVKNPVFTIRLKSNPSTGYRWYIRNYPADFIIPMKHTMAKSTSDLIGAPTQEIFEFKLKPIAFKVPHQLMIRFNYLRPFERSDKLEERVFRVLTSK